MTLRAFRHFTLGFLALAAAAAAGTMSLTASGRALTGTPQPSGGTVGGTWQMNVMHDHAIPFGIELKQDGTAVSGTLLIPALHGGKRESVTLEGTFVNGALALASTNDAESGRAAITITGTLKDDGTMEGEMSGSMGTMKWTAEKLGR